MQKLKSIDDCVNLLELEELAQNSMSKSGYDYYSGGATDEITLAKNIKAYQSIELLPRMLHDVSALKTEISLFDSLSESPILIAPMAFQKLAHNNGELATAKAAKKEKTIMVASTLSTHSLEEIKDVNEHDMWFQLYVYKDRGITEDLLERACKAGYKAVIVTVDSPVLGKREKDIKNRFSLPPGLEIKNLLNHRLETFPDSDKNSGLAEYIDSLYDRSLTFKDLKWIVDKSKLPVLVKGVLRADDAKKCLNAGAKGIVVSNHGGRQLDTTISTIDALPDIVDAVQENVPVLVDGGIRRGTDVLKALATGANAVLLGRPVLWGLAIDGESGVRRVLQIINAELKNAMALSGSNSIEEITSDLIHRTNQR